MVFVAWLASALTVIARLSAAPPDRVAGISVAFSVTRWRIQAAPLLLSGVGGVCAAAAECGRAGVLLERAVGAAVGAAASDAQRAGGRAKRGP